MTEKLTCSFCGKTQDEVKKLIAGHSLLDADGKEQPVYICDECIALCGDVIKEEIKKRTR